MERVRVGDIGTRFQRVAIDERTKALLTVTNAETLQITFVKPSGTVVTRTASAVADGDLTAVELAAGYSGKVFAWTTTASSDIDEAGQWSWQARARWSSAQDWKSNVLYFKAEANLW